MPSCNEHRLRAERYADIVPGASGEASPAGIKIFLAIADAPPCEMLSELSDSSAAPWGFARTLRVLFRTCGYGRLVRNVINMHLTRVPRELNRRGCGPVFQSLRVISGTVKRVVNYSLWRVSVTSLRSIGSSAFQWSEHATLWGMFVWESNLVMYSLLLFF